MHHLNVSAELITGTRTPRRGSDIAGASAHEAGQQRAAGHRQCDSTWGGNGSEQQQQVIAGALARGAEQQAAKDTAWVIQQEWGAA